jgi:hypothetical protein
VACSGSCGAGGKAAEKGGTAATTTGGSLITKPPQPPCFSAGEGPAAEMVTVVLRRPCRLGEPGVLRIPGDLHLARLIHEAELKRI